MATPVEQNNAQGPNHIYLLKNCKLMCLANRNSDWLRNHRLTNQFSYGHPYQANCCTDSEFSIHVQKMHIDTTMESQLESATATPVEQNNGPFQHCAYMCNKCTLTQLWNQNSNRLRPPLSNKMMLRFKIVHTCAQNTHWCNYGITTRICYDYPYRTNWCYV